MTLETSEDEEEFVLWDVDTDPRLAAYDFSDEDRCASDDPEADIVYASRDGSGWMDVSRDTDIRDVTAAHDGSSDPVSREWSPDHSVRLVDGHSYVVWTWDDQLFRFTVEAVSPGRIECTWAQVDAVNHYRVRGLTRDGENKLVVTRTSFPP